MEIEIAPVIKAVEALGRMHPGMARTTGDLRAGALVEGQGRAIRVVRVCRGWSSRLGWGEAGWGFPVGRGRPGLEAGAGRGRLGVEAGSGRGRPGLEAGAGRGEAGGRVGSK